MLKARIGDVLVCYVELSKLTQRRELGKTAPLLTRRRTPKWEPLRERMLAIIAQRPDLTLQELKDELETDLSRSTLCVALAKLRLTLKKKSSGPPSKSVRTSKSVATSGA